MPTAKDYYGEFHQLRDRINADQDVSSLDVASLFQVMKDECGEEVDAACDSGLDRGDVMANDVVG